MFELKGVRSQNLRMPVLVWLLLVPVTLFGQQAGGRGAAPPPPPKNLKLLAADTDIQFVMRNFNQALGVQCVYCHMQGDFASDANPKKEVTREMVAMVRQIDANYHSSAVAI